MTFEVTVTELPKGIQQSTKHFMLRTTRIIRSHISLEYSVVRTFESQFSKK
jgi:hypothetical protein